MTTYQLTNEGYVIRDDGARVPITTSLDIKEVNPDFVKYQDWLSAGGVPLPAELLPPEVPQQITRAQGKAALISQGLWASVLDFVATMPDDTQRALAEVALNDTLTWQRNSPFLNSATAQLGLPQTDLDALFIAASQIEF